MEDLPTPRSIPPPIWERERNESLQINVVMKYVTDHPEDTEAAEHWAVFPIGDSYRYFKDKGII